MVDRVTSPRHLGNGDALAGIRSVLSSVKDAFLDRSTAMSLQSRVIRIVEEGLCAGEPFSLELTDSFLESGLANSLKLMALLEALEREFQIAVEPGEFSPENLDSVAGITRYLVGKGVSD